MYLLQTPSFYAHVLNGLSLFLAIVFIVLNFGKLRGLNVYQRLTLLLLFAVATGIHGLSHFGLETVYSYNPLSFLQKA